MNQLDIQPEIEQAWVPEIQWDRDIFLMDYALSLGFLDKILSQINRCIIYLQAITQSNKTDAQVLYLAAAKHRYCNDARPSLFHWTIQHGPPETAWRHWNILLGNLSRQDKLLKPLGKWICLSTQRWLYLEDPVTSKINIMTPDGQGWTRHTVLEDHHLLHRRHICSQISWYHVSRGEETGPHYSRRGQLPSNGTHQTC
jgi:hypothetical protein